ncbi:MAG: ATP-binding protein [Oculatellaceae cyanobacterium Prado106]|nr:ATP-binding protein [Oculatellaceae cyanobacterium Prado106]
MIRQLRALSHLFSSPLSQRIVLGVFVSIVIVEVVILVPSGFRRKDELIDKFSMRSQMLLHGFQLAIREGNEAQLLAQAQTLQTYPLVAGGRLYRSNGTALQTFGIPPSLSLQEYRTFNVPQLERYDGRYFDFAAEVVSGGERYTLVLRYEAIAVSQELTAFVWRIGGLVLLISVFVTGATMMVLEALLITPIRQLRNDLLKTGEAVAQDQPLGNFTASIYPHEDEMGDVIGAFQQMAQQVVDAIAHRKQSEAALRQSELQLLGQTQQLQQTLQHLQQTQTQLVQSEKMSALGQLVAGIAHEINNPVNFIYGNLKHTAGYVQDLLHLTQQYQRVLPNPPADLQAELEEIDLAFLAADLPKILDSMGTGANRIREIVLSLRNFSRLDEADRKVADLHEGLDNTLLLLQHRLNGTGDRPAIQILRDYQPIPSIECYPGQLNQVFINLLSNAIDAIDAIGAIGAIDAIGAIERQIESGSFTESAQSPEIRISTEQIYTDSIRIRIADNGMGILPEVQPHIFDPFFTTKAVGQGTGMGLAIAYQIIVETHKGKLYCDSTPGLGSEFVVELAVAKA